MTNAAAGQIAIGAHVRGVKFIVPATEAAPKPPARPQILLETGVATTPVSGKAIQVAAGGDFQAALNEASPGDEIVLQAGATYTGNFVLPAKGGSGPWITIRTSDMAGLPKETVRVGPQHAHSMSKIIDPQGKGAISTALRAGYYRLIGLEITVSPSVTGSAPRILAMSRRLMRGFIQDSRSAARQWGP